MPIQALKISGSALIKPRPIQDERGSFIPFVGCDELKSLGLDFAFAQMNGSISTEAFTLRGLHMQRQPATETKMIRVLSGRLWDVLVDLRPHSPSFKQWLGIELSASERQILVVPPGCAHGFLTLVPNTEIMYLVDRPYSPEHEVILRWDDPSLNIEWPHSPLVISPKDRDAPDVNWQTL